MKPMNLNLSKMKKVSGDNESSTFEHPSGHKMVISHKGVSALQRKQLEKMPVHKMADGGDTLGSIIGYPGSPKPKPNQPHMYEAGGDTLPPELSDIPQDRAPASESAAQRFGDVLRTGASDALDTFKNVGSSVLSPVGDFAKGLVGVPDASANIPASAEQSHPMASHPAQMPMPDGTASAQDAKGSDFENAYQKGLKAIKEQQNINSSMADTQAASQRGYIVDSNALNDQIKQADQAHEKDQQDFAKDFAEGHIKPNAYVEHMGVPQKVASAIGLLLGGITSGPDGVNPAADYLNKQIDRDIDAQKSRQDDRKTLLAANEAKYKDKVVALNQTRMNMNDMVSHQIQLAAAENGTAQAKQAADAATSQYMMQNAALRQQNAIRGTLNNVQRKGGVIAEDPAKYVPYMVSNPEERNKVYEEIGRAQNVSRNSDKLLKTFDDASHDNTIIRTGAGLRTPGSVLALHQLMLPNFKQVDGTVRQAAMDETFHNLTPSPGDAPAKTAAKRQALMDWMHSETAAPIAKGNGLDLQQFQSTRAGAYPVQQQPVERVTPDGKVALFNPQTKQFMGYK